jgi:hypothetical protein
MGFGHDTSPVSGLEDAAGRGEALWNLAERGLTAILMHYRAAGLS